MEFLQNLLFGSLYILGFLVVVYIAYGLFWGARFAPLLKFQKYKEEERKANLKLNEIEVKITTEEEKFAKSVEKTNKQIIDQYKIESEHKKEVERLNNEIATKKELLVKINKKLATKPVEVVNSMIDNDIDIEDEIEVDEEVENVQLKKGPGRPPKNK